MPFPLPTLTAPEADPIIYKIEVTHSLGPTLSRVELESIIDSRLLPEHHLFSITDGTRAFLVGYDGTDFWYKPFTKAT